MSVSETDWTERSVDRVICIDRSEVVLEQVEHVAGAVKMSKSIGTVKRSKSIVELEMPM